MKFGHHGTNQPTQSFHLGYPNNSAMLNMDSIGNVKITSQNHGFVTDTKAIEKLLNEFQTEKSDQIFLELNLNDHTLEGFYLKTKKYHLMSIQYHPEASPGPHEGRVYFKQFKQMILDNQS